VLLQGGLGRRKVEWAGGPSDQAGGCMEIRETGGLGWRVWSQHRVVRKSIMGACAEAKWEGGGRVGGWSVGKSGVRQNKNLWRRTRATGERETSCRIQAAGVEGQTGGRVTQRKAA